MRNIRHIFVLMALAWAGVMSFAQVGSAPSQVFLSKTELEAQGKQVRFVKKDGAYKNDGKSWATAKPNIQDAINDLVNNGLTGEVWVQGAAFNDMTPDPNGVYTPTESTEQSAANTLYMSFKIPAGITVRGGFSGTETTCDTVYRESPRYAERQHSHRVVRRYPSIGWYYVNRTVLSGNLNRPAEFEWNATKQQFQTTFYGNCFHVVWFAMNGFDANGRAKGLTFKDAPGMDLALLEGCDVTGGYAYNRDLNGHPHNAYGGGIYMVQGAGVHNCYIYNCEATRDGGGVYMDGGGRLHHCYVSECQALGIGTQYGFGGGICMDDQNRPMGSGVLPMLLMGSGMTGNVARMGGGLAMHVQHPSRRNMLAAQAVLISNNTAVTEGGGVYFDNGGAIAHGTIVCNRCNGSGVTSNGMMTGRSGGAYVRNYANIVNSVLWGNTVAANNDLQFAASRATEQDRPKMSYSMLSKADYVDWSGVIKQNVKKLGLYNASSEGKAAAGEGYPLFHNPSPTAGYRNNVGIQTITSIGAGAANAAYDWQVSSRSSMMHQGLLTLDLDVNRETPANQGYTYDIVGKYFAPRATVGGYAIDESSCTPYVKNRVAHIFIDPNNINSGTEQGAVGSSWSSPARFLSDAFYEINRQHSTFTGSVDTLYIHIKEGTLDNTDNHGAQRARLATLNVPNIIIPTIILGGYPSDLEDTDVSRRTPIRTPSIFTGELMDDYKYYGAHMFTLNGLTSAVTIDGIQVLNVNAASTELANTNTSGAAFTITNCSNVTLRNISVSGCTAATGAAILASGSTVHVENALIRNNEGKTQAGGLVRATNGSTLTFDHCAVVRNVGVPAYMDATSYTTWVNSYFYANLSQPVEDTNTDYANAADGDEGHNKLALASFAGTTAHATGNHCMFDKASVQFSSQFGGNDTGHPYQYNLRYHYEGGIAGGYPRFINPTKNAGVNPNGDATYYGRGCSYEPHNISPLVNMASAAGDHSTWGTDMTATVTRDYGGRPDIGPVENHMANKEDEGENAYTDGQAKYGTIYYVKDYGNCTDGGDGSSWATAINGNAYYYPDGSHGCSATKKMTHKDSTWVDAGVYYLDGAAKTISGAVNLTGVVFQIPVNSKTSYLTYDGSKLDYTEDLESATLFDVSGTANNYSIRISNNGAYLGHQTSSAGIANTNNTWMYDGGKFYYTYTKSKKTQHAYFYVKSTWLVVTTRYSIDWKNTENSHSDAVPVTIYTRGKTNEGHWEYREITDQTVNGVIGLQWAVDKAYDAMASQFVRRQVTGAEKHGSSSTTTTRTYYNLPTGVPQRYVYVAAGTYTKTDGFLIKNHVKVYGSFPKVGNPGINERHPLLSSGIALSDANHGLTISDYETILQTNSSKGASTYKCSVLSQPVECRTTTADDSDTPQSRTIYEGCEWDGFTIRYGYRAAAGGRNGGGGVSMYDGVTLRNCVVRDNTVTGGNNRLRGAGVYCDGSTVIACYIMDNVGSVTNEAYGGGMYMIRGTIYNSVIAGNQITGGSSKQGVGCYFESANFYNNTVVNNTGGSALGVYTASGADAHLTLYNSIVMAQDGQWLLTRASGSTKISFTNCFLQTNKSEISDATTSITYGPNESDIKYTSNFVHLSKNAITANPFALEYNTAVSNKDYRISSDRGTYNCVNKGTPYLGKDYDGVTDVILPGEDMDYEDRIQDCTVDIGAYEYNGAFAITPTLVNDSAFFYVTPEGFGEASGTNPANAACADKLQKVLDAAGRYKYNNKTKKVIVKCATTDGTLDDEDNNPMDWAYYANRSTNPTDRDVRVWSIIVPEGVELWGGYTNANLSNATNNGFKTRDIMAHPTRFDAFYHNKAEKTDAYTYHVFTFTNYVYDDKGIPYLKEDAGKVGTGSSSYKPEESYQSGTNFLLMASNETEQRNMGRATVDGAFITGGKADIHTVSAAGVDAENINQYGGAAIVNEYGHIRNCVAKNNYAIRGGAFALTQHGIISGTLITENEAEEGAGVYVFNSGTKLSDGYEVNMTAEQSRSMDYKMPHIITSTIVNNHAKQQGGGLWYNNEVPNVRVNSTVIWQNEAQDQANVHGLFSPTKAENDPTSSIQFYPFSYSAVQNIRMTGSSNITLPAENKAGARFGKTSKDIALYPTTGDRKTIAEENKDTTGMEQYADFGYYALTNNSMLTHAGMTVEMYNQFMPIAALSEKDITGLSRFVHTFDPKRSYVDIGARVIDKEVVETEVMLRLYVAPTELQDMNAIQAMQAIVTEKGAPGYDAEKAYYSQEGSSFAYPMRDLQDALDYIYSKRELSNDLTAPTHAKHLPFEIIMAGGTYYPKRDMSGAYTDSKGRTFAIPEGVSIIGGFSPTELGENVFYGRGNDPEPAATLLSYDADAVKNYNINEHVTARSAKDITISGFTIRERPTTEMMNHRQHTDLNANGLIEPWEFMYQTVLSGNVENKSENGVYHVVTLVADETVVGPLPKPYSIYGDYAGATNKQHHHCEMGQEVTLNGVQISGGYASNYVSGALDSISEYSYYHGGAILVDGNRYADTKNKGVSGQLYYRHTGASNAYGYRNLPLTIVKCRFNENQAGYGGAISANGTVEIFSCAFENNKAEAKSESLTAGLHVGKTVAYPGVGGAIYATAQCTSVNTLFANNEADDAQMSLEPRTFPTLRVQTPSRKVLGGAGGAVYGGLLSHLHFINCNLVNNMANSYPAVYTANPNYKIETLDSYMPAMLQYNQLVNTVAWGNRVNPAMNLPAGFHPAKLICNYGRKERNGAEYVATAKWPATQAELDGCEETAWFSAYEQGLGITPLNTADHRDMQFDPRATFENIFLAQGKEYQNCNVELDSDNGSLAGPNFVSPSHGIGKAGYLESADWAPARLNRLTDNGFGRLYQRIVTNGDSYECQWIMPTSDSNNFSGAYPTVHFIPGYPEYTANMPMYDEPYMASDFGDIHRISFDPNPTHDQTYIDIGVYEYVHVELKPQTEGDEVDIIWVSSAEKPENGLPEGSSWTQPTSDLQRAIESLLASRNGHRKEIRLMDGTYMPIYSIDNHSAFYINTLDANSSVLLPVDEETGNPILDRGVRSLTFRGGYSRDLNGVYDVDLYPAVIRQQTRTNGTSDQWDKLIYIADATQRYGALAYNGANENGWYQTIDDHKAAAVKTIPIEFDGVSIINDQALPHATGSAIYYANQSATTCDSVHVTTPTITVGGEEKHQWRNITGGDAYKLIISRSTIYGSGTAATVATNDTTGTAVYTGTDAWGKTLIYNSVFHSNLCTPLYGANITGINNTFALNGGYPQMPGTSRSHNSIYWRNHEGEPMAANRKQFMLGGYVDDANSGSIFSYNAYTGAATADYSATYNYNAGLGVDAKNTDVINGPNFKDPENADLGLRSFQLNPSRLLINKGSNAIYQDSVRAADAPHADRGDWTIYSMAWQPLTRQDAASNPRIMAYDIDLGAYEYQNSTTRVLYVDPNQTTNGTGTGWGSPMGSGHIQDAIDLAGVYHANSVQEKDGVKDAGEPAYVFVKGASATNKGLHTNEVLTPRDGVVVIGGIISDYAQDCKHEGDVIFTYQDSDVKLYIDSLLRSRPGIVGPEANKTTILGIRTESSGFANNTYTLMDGFDIVNPAASATEPVLYINPLQADGTEWDAPISLALRSIVVHGNTMAAATNVAEVNNALLYEALFFDNKTNGTGKVLNVGSHGYVVSSTVEGSTVGTTDNVKNSLINWTAEDGVDKCFSGYQSKSDQGRNYPMCNLQNWDSHDLDFQLIESSPSIDACDTVNPLKTVAPAVALFIDYQRDYDLLGNPRVLKNVTNLSRLDKGAFETWRVDRSFECGTHGTNAGLPIADKHYPHAGSVCYIMANQSLIIDPIDAEHEVAPSAHYPAYTLLKEGASLYGNGRAVTLPYIAIERTIPAEGAVISLPFNFLNHAATNNVSKPQYVGPNSSQLVLAPAGGMFYTYDGSKRAEYDYNFADVNSECWVEAKTPADPNNIQPTDFIPANTGMLYVPAQGPGVYRFTSRGRSIEDYYYEEDANDISKSVTLTQYDEHPNDGTSHFTPNENMGWNCTGMPYLVSDYRTYEYATVADHKVAHANETYMMKVPHTLWLYFNGVQSPDGMAVNGDGGFYSVESWNNGWKTSDNTTQARLWTGEGFFTQTKKLGEPETLTFYRPLPPATPSRAASPVRIREVLDNQAEQPEDSFHGESIKWEKIMVNELIYLIRRNDAGEVVEAYDLLGHKMM